MNILLWVLQIMLAWLAIAGGYFQIFKIEKLQETVAAMRGLPQGLWALFGVIGIVAGLGLVLPETVKQRGKLVPMAATMVALESLVLSGLYLAYGDSAPLPFSLTMAGMGAVIAYARRKRRPL